jgi:biopolymer transport protein ExbB
VIQSLTGEIVMFLMLQAGTGAAAPAAAGTAGAAGAVGPLLESKSLLGYIAAGGFVAVVLLLLSALAVGLVIANGAMLRKTALAKPGTTNSLEMLLRERKVDQAIAFCRAAENDCFLTRVLGAGLSKARSSQFGVLEAKPVMEEAGRREADKLDRVTYAIRVVADLAPMLGLLGTVIGIIKAFATIGGAEGASRSAQLSANMSEALVNTALGLAIAIPCLMCHAFFKRQTEAVLGELADTADRLISILQQPAAGVRQAAAAPAAPAAAAPAGNGSVPLAAGAPA